MRKQEMDYFQGQKYPKNHQERHCIYIRLAAQKMLS
jgi:hypothetical protein